MGNQQNFENEFDLEFTKLINNVDLEVPETVRARVDQILQTLPPRRFAILKKVRYVAAAAVLLLGLTVGLGFLSPGVAQALRQIPIIGSIFEFTGDAGMQDASTKGFASPVNETVTDNGISITITDVIFDGTRISIAYLQESTRDVGNILEMTPDFRGVRVAALAVSQTGKLIKKNQYAGVIDISTPAELPDKFTLKMDINKVGSVRGSWDFKIPISNDRTVSDTREFYPLASKTDNGRTLTVKKITFAPSATGIDLEMTEPVKEQELYEIGIENRIQESYLFEIFDDHGQAIPSNGNGSVEIKGKTEILRYKGIATTPISGRPEYLIIRPVLQRSTWITADLSDRMPITLNLGKNQQLTITQIDFLPDKTLLHFKGFDPYNTLYIRDSAGEEFSFDYKKPPAKDKDNAFVREYPAFNRDEKLTVVTIKDDEPLTLGGLEMKVQLDW